MNKYIYLQVIQQHYTSQYGWEDCSEYVKGEEDSLLAHDLKEYREMGYPTRVIKRRELNPEWPGGLR